MTAKFIKMQVCGNDYLLFDGEELTTSALQKHTQALCDRRFGVGADGTVLLSFCEGADGKMRMFNADGSEGKMCGSALCMAAVYFYGRLLKSELAILTQSGDKKAFVKDAGERVSVQAEMGAASFMISADKNKPNGGLLWEVDVAGKKFELCRVDVGNPHAVIFVLDDETDVSSVGKALQTHPVFHGGVNVEFVRLLSRREISVRVFERGSGETLCCCTGACAAVAAGQKLGVLDDKGEIFVRYAGGTVRVKKGESGLMMTAEPKTCFSGEVEWCD
jgi:diaminopimelate epimerase